MKRKIEELTHKRLNKEESLKRKLGDIKEKGRTAFNGAKIAQAQSDLSQLKPDTESLTTPVKSGLLPSSPPSGTAAQKEFNQKILAAVQKLADIIEKNQANNQDLIDSLTDVTADNVDLAEARDREWDALSSNHVGMIFKSIEWRIDKLAAGYEDATLLMRKFTLLREKLNSLLDVLEQKKLPTPDHIKTISLPLEDFQYAGFENRYRGSEASVREQQEAYLAYFKPGKKVLDLGCGRGEFLELLAEKGIEAEGVDINEQMLEACRDKGYKCRNADILETLAACEDNSLGGIFSSQVAEHLPPAYLKRMIELAYFKLAPDGIIVLETINPASVFALVQIYFLDISHQQPIHPQALKFLAESAGFANVEIKLSSPLETEPLQSLPVLDESTRINNLLFAPVNYALIGEKK